MPRKPKPKLQSVISLKALSDKALEKLWSEMRLEFETTPIGIRELARKFGLKSHTPLLRKVQAESWRKQPDLMSAHIATEAVIDVLASREGGADRSKSGPKPGAADHPDVEQVAENSGEIANSRPGSVAGPLAVANQAGAVRAARRMAQVQQNQLLKEIALADQAIDMSTQMLTLLKAVLVEEDPVKAALIVARFSAIGSKQESFSGLMRAAVGGLKDGIAMRRRALQMEKTLGLDKSATQGELPEQVRSMLPNLTTAQLMDLRRAGEVMNKQIEMTRPRADEQVIDGIADAILDAEDD